MPRLTTERYLQARAFLHDRARPLELAQFEHDFEGAAAWPVLDALAAFQNPDGGFGHGLEPDSVTPTSGALASSVALRILAAIAAPPAHPMVRSLVSYLLESCDQATGTWRIVPSDTSDFPHAPWWAAEGLEERFSEFKLNPRAEIVAHLLTLGAGVDQAWLQGQTLAIVREVDARLTAGGLEMHELMAACRLLDAGGVPGDLRQALRKSLTTAAVDALRAGSSGGYGLRALSVAPRPGSTLADTLADIVVLELEGLVAEQAADGAWWPAWDWGAPRGSEAAAAWDRSKTAWAGIITLDNLRTLSANGMVDRG